MPARDVTAIVAGLKDAWNSEPEFSVSIALVEFLNEHWQDTSYLTYGFINELARERRVMDPNAVARVIQYFLSAHLLEMRFEFQDEDDKAYPIALDVIEHARRNGRFAHPMTGELELDFESKLFVYFLPSPEARKIFAAEPE
jgi:hypothetical protein